MMAMVDDLIIDNKNIIYLFLYLFFIISRVIRLISQIKTPLDSTVSSLRTDARLTEERERAHSVNRETRQSVRARTLTVRQELLARGSACANCNVTRR